MADSSKVDEKDELEDAEWIEVEELEPAGRCLEPIPLSIQERFAYIFIIMIVFAAVCGYFVAGTNGLLAVWLVGGPYLGRIYSRFLPPNAVRPKRRRKS